VNKPPQTALLQDEHGKRREQQAPAEHDGAHLPRKLPLSAAGEHPLHHAEDVEAREEVEGLKDDIPDGLLLVGVEEVDVARAEDGGIQDLGNEGDALS